MKTPTDTLIAALRILARDIESGDGVANACIAEAADRLEEYYDALKQAAGADGYETDCMAMDRIRTLIPPNER